MLVPREVSRKRIRRNGRNNSEISLGKLSNSSKRSNRSIKKHLKSHYSPARAIQFDNDLSMRKYLHNVVPLPGRMVVNDTDMRYVNVQQDRNGSYEIAEDGYFDIN
jgi:hypothetical protein